MIPIEYRITKGDGAVVSFLIRLDPATLELEHEAQPSYPAWTRLGHHQCPNCPLDEARSPLCPVARNLSTIAESFKQTQSIEVVDVEIVTEERTYLKRLAVQHAVSSLTGIVMVTSGCPVLEKLKPMVRTHLPFASLQESVYRLVSMYLLAQYFVMKEGSTPDWELRDLGSILHEVNRVNATFLERLRSMSLEDATLNAVVHLDCFASLATLNLRGEDVAELRGLFAVYLRGSATSSSS